ncbi:MAG: fibronectin type III domain-containing protein [Opitutales bacterium]|nr:fibronectin type III domain-containing protein [Opitutales bacterium]
MKHLKNTQSNLAALTVSLVLLGMTSVANAAILAYEPFDYPLGALSGGDPTTATGTPTATTGGGFTSTWFSGGAGTMIVEGLTYPGLQTSENALQWSPSVDYHGLNLASALLPSATPAVYVSFLYRAPSFTANKAGFAVDNGAGANQGYYMGMTAPGVFGVATVVNGSGSVLGTASESISFNTTYFVVVRFDANAGGTYYQSGSIWINPTPGGPEPAASGTFTGTYTAMTRIQTFLTALGGSTVTTDEIRFGTTWASVTPSSGATAPSAPTDLQVDSTGTNTVNLSWTAASGSPISYNVKRSTASGGPYATIGTTTEPTVTFTDTVTGGTTYYYVVSAVSGGGESANSTPVSVMPALGVPDAPTGLAATAGDSQVGLNWTAPAIGNPTSYNVWRSTVSGGPYTGIGTATAPATSFNDTTAENGTTYYYVVTAVNAAGESDDSSEVLATPAVFTGIYEPFDYPIEDNLLNGTPSTAEGFGVWTNGVAGWITTGLTYPGLPTSKNAMRSPAGRQSVSLDNPLSSGTKWISFLFRSSPGNPGANKNGVYFLNGGTGLFFGFGLDPFSATQGYLGLGSTNTVGTAAQGATLLTRTGLGTYGSTYLIVLKIDFNTSGSNDTITVYVNPTTNQPAPGVTPAATFSGFNVGTITGIGMNVQGGGDITVDEFRIADTYVDVVDAVVIPPNVPTGLSATAGNNAISLSWTAATGGTPTGYNVKRATDPAGPFSLIGSTTAPAVTYTDSVLGGTIYYYVVSAVNAIGESADSSVVSASAILAAPPAPRGLSAQASDSQVSLSWSTTTFAASYEVKRASSPGGPYSSIGTTSGLTFVDTSVTNAQTYYYVVSAVNAGGASPDSSAVSATPVGPLPFVLEIEPGVGITWFASQGATYQVQWASEDLGPEDTEWNDMGSPVTGDDSTMTFFDPMAPPGNMYQVISY